LFKPVLIDSIKKNDFEMPDPNSKLFNKTKFYLVDEETTKQEFIDNIQTEEEIIVEIGDQTKSLLDPSIDQQNINDQISTELIENSIEQPGDQSAITDKSSTQPNNDSNDASNALLEIENVEQNEKNIFTNVFTEEEKIILRESIKNIQNESEIVEDIPRFEFKTQNLPQINNFTKITYTFDLTSFLEVFNEENRLHDRQTFSFVCFVTSQLVDLVMKNSQLPTYDIKISLSNFIYTMFDTKLISIFHGDNRTKKMLLAISQILSLVVTYAYGHKRTNKISTTTQTDQDIEHELKRPVRSEPIVSKKTRFTF